ncbi:MAG: 1-acyl-sn-glycerol-3-phosphate acyltransferase [Lachnospiraceae bacterium]|nr:1-acyl-sn-glycerol-3-phosphate acyltransferase [Lachnospiraceae bacterium]
MIRTFFVFLFIFLFLLITLPLDLVLYLISRKNPDLQIRICRKIIHWAFTFILWICGVHIKADGQENIPEGAVLFVGNHQSYLDILTTYVSIKGGTGYVSKIEMDKVPVFNLWMRGINCLFLDRDNIREGIKTIKKGTEELKKGYSMFIFPEGTRNQAEEMLEFKAGSTKMAEKANVPILPVAISGTADIFENNAHFSVKPGKVRITFGKPIIINDLAKEERRFLSGYTQNIIKEMLNSHKQEI